MRGHEIHVLSIVEKLSSSRRLQMYLSYRESKINTCTCVFGTSSTRSITDCPCLSEGPLPEVRGFTVHVLCIHTAYIILCIVHTLVWHTPLVEATHICKACRNGKVNEHMLNMYSYYTRYCCFKNELGAITLPSLF